MLKIALTGNRYSGKTGVSKIFKQLQVPVFDADTVLKYILNFKTETKTSIRKNVGNYLFTGDKLDKCFFVTRYVFDKTIDIAEFELFEAWNRFLKKHSDKPYVIFECSILFERTWSKRFDGTICVFTPKEDRIDRARQLSMKRVDTLWSILDSEMSELDKNNFSNWIIHNYEDGPDVLKQINTVDTKIIDLYLEKDKQKFRQ